MSQIVNSLKVSSANCQGLQGKEKRRDVISFFKDKNYHIVCLQDTHLIKKDIQDIREMWGGECFIHGIKSNARGVAILIGNNFEYKVLNCHKDLDGNYLYIKLKLDTMSLNLITIYGPNSDNPNFFQNIQDILEQNSADYSIVCGDFNMVLNPELDTYNYLYINNPKARTAVQNMIDSEDLIDIFRQNYPQTRRYTWRKRNPIKQARLDYFLISNQMSNIIKSCNIKAGYRFDHLIIELEIILNKFIRGKGLWKFNNSLLKDKEYLTLVNKIIEEEVIKYAIPVYNNKFVANYCNYGNITLTIDWDTFLELLIMHIRGETIKFSSRLKQKTNLKEEELIQDIEHLERTSSLDTHLDLLEDKKVELEQIRKSRLKGELVRSRIQWLSEGEKPSKYFCNLEKKNFLAKTIRSVQLENGSQVLHQEEILKCVGQYYQRLFKNNDNQLANIDLFTTFENAQIKKNCSENLGEKINVKELSDVLKKMKNNKTPGIDGITSEFLKVFWGRLKYVIHNAINASYDKGLMSQSMRTCIITCLPKGNKDRKLLKNWRPISLLSSIYKLMSGVIANRLRNTLDTIISNTQTGFLSGRQISDNTRLIYDLMHIAENKKIAGMLMLIDFEKAFDSISWNFLYNTLLFFGFSQSFIKWIKMFNNNIEAYVLQCGKPPPKITIGRGCRQGDPISSYLFLLAAEILSLLVNQSQNIRGFKINGIEFKLTQFADDTTLILDGSQPSLQAALNILEIYGNYSGLKMNKEKTKVIWIGKKRLSKEKLNVSVKLDWGSTEFTLLGLDFSTDLNKMEEINYTKIYEKMNGEINKWKNRKLTPFGKISIIKSNVLSKGIHVMTSLPTPETFLSKVNSLLYSFLWNNKPDKIKRTTICQDFSNGGLAMVNIYHFEKALKTNWVKRIFIQMESQWRSLLLSTCKNLNNLTKFGGNYGIILKQKVQNSFWQRIFEYWSSLTNSLALNSNSDIVQSCLWYNAHISSENLYYPMWAEKGILFVGDLLLSNGEILKLKDIERIFKITINTFYYYRIKLLLKTFIETNKKDCSFASTQPIYPFHLKCLSGNSGCKTLYKMFSNNAYSNTVPLCRIKWGELLGESDNEQTWKLVFKACCKSVLDNSIIWLQYKILFDILPTRDYLYKLKLTDNNLCVFCHCSPETIIHLFCECNKVQDLWSNIKQWIFMKTGITINFSKSIKLLGFHEMDHKYWPLNLVILLTKKYIFSCARKELRLNIFNIKMGVMEKPICIDCYVN